MMFRLVLISSAISGLLLASDNASTLSAFPDANKSLQQLARDSVDRQIAASVHGKRGEGLPSPLGFAERRVMRPQRVRAEACSIPLLESKIQHPERFRTQVLKVPAKPIDNMATLPTAPACEGRN
jgi:hypothetical protein